VAAGPTIAVCHAERSEAESKHLAGT